jgi:hypothetical protein
MSAQPLHVLSVIPPMTQLNTPYPSTAYLTGFLHSRGVSASQEDLALKLVLKLFSTEGLHAIHERVKAVPRKQRTPALDAFEDQFERYADTIDAYTIGEEGDDPIGWAFGALGMHDRAKHLATLYLNDLADVLRDAVDPRFQFVRYAESLAASQPTFDPLAEALAAPHNLVDELLHGLTLEAVRQHQPRLVLISTPFPGNVYAAFRIAQSIKAHDPGIVTALGGGFVNTELRELSDPRVFDHFDYVTLDAGERPLLSLIEHLQGQRAKQRLVRTFVRDDTQDGTTPPKVRLINWQEPDIAFADVGTPTWQGLPLDQYLSLLDMLNPMNRLWRMAATGRSAASAMSAWTTSRATKALRPRCWLTASKPSSKKPARPDFISSMRPHPRKH